ncbi:carbonic anhydrase 7-like [Penaeus japonicus]|uniref:carbonic anhydrase 7-like n=1 Tax=Penaeus japonicus TaxID=27405 RepID=UPI001C7169DC|nr:carbonic anhydrase 7-like [Penaeus japonicus]
MLKVLLATEFVFLVIAAKDDGHAAPHWGYEGATGPQHWPDLFPDFCAGSSQSPIDLDDHSATLVTSTDAWALDKYAIVPPEMIIKNNGHTAQVEWTLTDINELPYISGGNLGSKYTFAQFHFHWGSVHTQGSEHTINGLQYPAELHLVHFKSKYETIGEAVLHEDGLAVLGIMLEISDVDNEHLTPIIAGLATVPHSGDQESLTTLFSLGSLLPEDTSSFYRYQGSLTTPTCNEVVTWTVFSHPITISETQLEAFRALLDEEEHHIEDNFRPVQHLNGRTLEKVQLE